MCVLRPDDFFGLILQLLAGHAHVRVFHNGLLQQLPTHRVGVAGVFLLQLLIGQWILVVHLDPTLQEGVGHLNLHVLDEVHNEPAAENVLRIAVELIRQLLGHFLAEVLLGADHVFAEDFVPKALVVFCGGEALDFFDFESELSL